MKAFPNQLTKNYATHIVELEASEAKNFILKSFILILIAIKLINLF